MEIVNKFFPTRKFRKVDTTFWTESAYKKEIMDSLPSTGNFLRKAEMEYPGKFGNILGCMQHIFIMSIIEICCTSLILVTTNVAPNIPCFQGIKS